MKRSRLILIPLVLLVTVSGIFAQNRGALTIQCDQIGAQVYLNDRLAGTTTPNFTQLLPVGKYSVKVIKSGYKPFESIVTMIGGPVVLNVVLSSPSSAPAAARYKLAVSALASGVSVSGAQVSVNGAFIGLAPVATTLEAGNYVLSITAPHFEPYTTTVSLVDNLSHSAVLRPRTYTLSISAQADGMPIPNALISMNGHTSGQAPIDLNVQAGAYALVITADDYERYEAIVSVDRDMNHIAVLKPMLHRLSVSANVAGAEVYLNKVLAGIAPLSLNLSPGSYLLSVKAPGYADYELPLHLSAPQTVSARLNSLPARVTISIPSQLTNWSVSRPETKVEFYVDGVRQAGLMAELTAGVHVLRFTAGGLAAQTTYDLKAGVSYVLEPVFGLNLK